MNSDTWKESLVICPPPAERERREGEAEQNSVWRSTEKKQELAMATEEQGGNYEWNSWSLKQPQMDSKHVLLNK